MRVFAFAALAAIGFAGAAYAGDGSTGTTTAAAPKAMSDSEMDQVTAGVALTFDNGHTIHSVRSGADAIGPIGGVGAESVVIPQNGNVIVHLVATT